MAGRDVGRTRVDVLTIDLVGEEIEVVLLHDVAYLVHLAAGVEVARGVVGVTYQDGLGAFVDELLELLHLGQRETFLNGGCHGADDRPCRDGKGHVVGVCGFGHDDFVSRVQTAQEGEEHGFGTSGGDDDIVGREVDVVLLVVAHQLLAVALVALRWAVLQHGAVDVAYCVEGCLGCGQVGLTDVEVIHVYSPFLGVVSQGCQLADRRCRHFISSDRYSWHNDIRLVY